MDIKVSGRNVEVTEPLRQYAEEKIGRFDRYLTTITEAIVTMSVQKHMHKVEVQIKANGTYIQAESVTIILNLEESATARATIIIAANSSNTEP